MRRKIMKNAISILSLCIVYAISMPSLAFASSAIPVKAVYAKKTIAVKNITSPGKVHSNGRQIFTAPFTGRLIESFPFPKFVAAGTVIARVASPGLYAKIISARAAVKYAKIKFKREKLLFNYGVAAKKTLEQAALNLSDAHSSLQALESLESEGILISRFKGTVHYLTADGSIVAAAGPVAVLNGKGSPWIKTYVTPSQSFNLYGFCFVIYYGKYKSLAFKHDNRSFRQRKGGGGRFRKMQFNPFAGE